jgi:hypothetical protein
MADFGLLPYYLGMEVSQGKAGIWVSQRAYALKILAATNMEDCISSHIPMESQLKLSKSSTAPLVDATEYRKICGCLEIFGEHKVGSSI